MVVIKLHDMIIKFAEVIAYMVNISISNRIEIMIQITIKEGVSILMYKSTWQVVIFNLKAYECMTDASRCLCMCIFMHSA